MIISVPVDETLDGMNELLRPIRRELVGLHGEEVEIEDVRDVPSTDHRLHLLPKVLHGLPVVHLRIMEQVLLRNHEQEWRHPHMHNFGRISPNFGEIFRFRTTPGSEFRSGKCVISV